MMLAAKSIWAQRTDIFRWKDLDCHSITRTELKEISKVFYCELCGKQYKLAVEFEAHLGSYDHNHRKRFKEMKEMHGSSSRDDSQKREQQRQEKEMAKFVQIADARKQQLQQQQEESGPAPVSTELNSATTLEDQDQRKALKFGFSSKGGTSKSKISFGSAAKKSKVAVASVFGNDSDEEWCDSAGHQLCTL